MPPPPKHLQTLATAQSPTPHPHAASLPLSSCRRLWVVRQELPRLPIMALTATASERVQRDIVAQLRLRDPLMLQTSFNRPNIAYEGCCREGGQGWYWSGGYARQGGA